MKTLWRVAHERDVRALSTFLESREWQCVSFSGHLLEGGSWKLPRRYRKRVFLLRSRSDPDQLDGAVLQTANGFVYPVFGSEAARSESMVDQLVTELKAGFGRVSTLMGVDRDVEAVERRFHHPPEHALDYDLLSFTSANDVEVLRRHRARNGVVIRRARPEDLSRLLPLQEAYEREEVLLPGRTINVGLTMRSLQHSIERQLVLLASVGGQVVAKAATNARGGRFDQLGGVYTVPEYRGRGIGSLVVSAITRSILSQRRGVALFVKKDNLAAQRLYAGLGFSHVADLRISYYA